MPFGTGVKPRLAASSRACRAVIAAREESPELGYAALRAIQLMQFTTSGLLDDDDDLRGALETVDGLDAAAVVARIDDPAIVAIYDEDKARTRSAEGRPTHVQNRHSESDGPVRYTAPTRDLRDARRALARGRRLPALRVLRQRARQPRSGRWSAGRRRSAPPMRCSPSRSASPPPRSPRSCAAPTPRTTPIPGAERELIAAVDDGELVGIPAGTDALWRPASAVAAEPDALSAAA